jgi:hypothetical protein
VLSGFYLFLATMLVQFLIAKLNQKLDDNERLDTEIEELLAFLNGLSPEMKLVLDEILRCFITKKDIE